MSGRRRDPRYRLAVPWEGSISVLQDVVVERQNERDIWAIGEAPAEVGQALTLDLTAAGRRDVTYVRVAESTPVVADGNFRYRLRLSIVERG